MNAHEWVQEYVDCTDVPLQIMPGYDDCIVGVVQRFNSEPFVVYDKAKLIKRLMAEGMTYPEAVEFHEYNQLGAWMGPHTPGFIELPNSQDSLKFEGQ